MKHHPKVLVIILNWNGLKDTIECLESLKSITYPNYEIIVVDNGSETNDADILKQKYKKFIKLIRSRENLGYAGGNNIGLRESIKSGADFSLLLNNDTIVKSNFLDELVKIAMQVKSAFMIGSLIYNYYNQKIVFTNFKIDKKLISHAKMDYINSKEEYWETEMVSGAAMMLKTKYILKYNLFLNENMFLFCEELDIALRAKKLNLKAIMAKNSKIYHKGGMSYGGKVKPLISYYMTRNRILIAKTLLSLPEKNLFWLNFLPARLYKILFLSLAGKYDFLKADYFGFLDGLRNKKGKTNRKL